MTVLRRYRGPVLIAIMSFCLIAYMYLNPPLADGPLLSLGLAGDLDAYVSRFVLSLMCFAAVPGTAAVLLGFGLAELGLVWHRKMFRWPFYWILFPVFVLVIGASSFDQAMRDFYPFSKQLQHLAVDRGPLWFLVHAALYGLFYYVPWEVLFRGLMILPLVNHIEAVRLGNHRANAGARNRGLRRVPLVLGANDRDIADSWKDPLLISLAMIQTIPTVMIHFPHPITETVGTVVFGALAAVIVLRTRSVIPVILLHAAAGIILDFSLYLQAAGVF
jgi:hypothetical protein